MEAGSIRSTGISLVRHRSHAHRSAPLRAARRLAAPLALALLAAGCARSDAPLRGPAVTSGTPPPPPVVELGTVPVTDDLHRFVVGPFDSAAAAALTASGAAAPPVADDATCDGGNSPATGGDGSSGGGGLRSLPPGATLAVELGVPGYRGADGTFVPLDDGALEDPAAACPEAATGARAAVGAGGGTVADPDDELGLDPLRAALAARDGVVDVQPIGDGRYAVAATADDVLAGTGVAVTPDPQVVFTADPYEGYQWTLDNTGHNLDATDAPPPQRADADIDGREAASARGTGVVVAVVDSGADLSHPDLAAAEWTNTDESCNNGTDDDGNGYVDDCRGWDFGYEDNRPYAAGNPDHATHVAGIIAAQPGNGIGIAGIAPAVKIMNLSVAGPGGMTVSGVARAVRYAVDNGADIVNLSLGTTPGTPAAAVQPMFDAVAYAQAHGVLLVVAAGNSNVDIGATAVYPASIPGANMLVVGASGPDDTRASFSNYGSPVDIFAPGVMIASTLPNRAFGFMSGTSQAAPTTAATAALVLGRNHNLSPAQVIAQLVGTADQIGPLSNWVTNGVRLNAARAIGVMADAGSVADVSITGLSTAGGHLQAQVALDEGPGFDRPYRWEATLVALRASAGATTAYGLVGLPVTVEGEAATTDQRGAITLSAGGSGAAFLTADLPAGTYGLVVEAVPIADPSMRLGQAFAATFEIAPTSGSGGGGGTTATTAPASTNTTSGSGGGGGTTATTAPATATTAPGSSPTTARAATTTTAASGAVTTAPRATVASTTTAAAPATTARAATSTTAAPATAAPTATTARPATTTTAAAPAGGGATTATSTVNGQWAVFTISPRSGPVSYGTVVSIAGSFPEAAYVWFGNQQGQVLFQSSSWILVTTPPVAEAGPVDVTLRTAAGTVLTLPGAFTFRDAATASGGGSGGTGSTSATTAPPAPSPTTAPASGGTSPTTASGGTSSGGTGSGGAGSGGAGSGGGTSPTTAPSADNPGTSPATTAPAVTAAPATTAPPDPALSPRTVTAGAPVDLGGGLTGVAFNGWSTLGSVPACASDPCRARSI
ncbi:MAG: S8 family serine peptidase [Acidimicrobiales bacterium]